MIGSRLKEERERLGMSQPAFAELAGAKKRALINWEKGETSPTAEALSRLHGYGLDVNYVITGVREQGAKVNMEVSKYAPLASVADIAVDSAKTALLAIHEIRDLQGREVAFPEDLNLILKAIRVVADAKITGAFTPEHLRAVFAAAKERS
ncbi:helix-turn-helix domain-containing protein [Bowmanella denitrificans]|uniref:helix-turn-helix domain-containing protein n=1 Tax=Bowmanella denitrificans TaxID=366582 RepID=UPI000C9BF465|nr:helix-turn-helix transcriptional regulator [Bowmanella denitrificans]